MNFHTLCTLMALPTSLLLYLNDEVWHRQLCRTTYCMMKTLPGMHYHTHTHTRTGTRTHPRTHALHLPLGDNNINTFRKIYRAREMQAWLLDPPERYTLAGRRFLTYRCVYTGWCACEQRNNVMMCTELSWSYKGVACVISIIPLCLACL